VPKKNFDVVDVFEDRMINEKLLSKKSIDQNPFTIIEECE